MQRVKPFTTRLYGSRSRNRIAFAILCAGLGSIHPTQASACIFFLPCPIPVFDVTKLGQFLIQRPAEAAKQVGQAQTVATRTRLNAIQDQQIAQLDALIAMLSGTSGFIGTLDTVGGIDASQVYAIDDNNPFANRLFGDAPTTVEEMIALTAQKHATNPALAAAGINAAEWRAYFQAMIKQESNFSIGARSPKAAFGLTQIIPGTAKQLGIYPAYYDDPMLQLDGGARYLLTQLGKFGSMNLALAAYNAGPGAVQKYGGIPPYKETQDYVVRINAYYRAYAAQISGVAQLGTLSPGDMAIAEAGNVADAGIHYSFHAASQIVQSLRRLKGISREIPTTLSAKEAWDLNSYAKIELARIDALLTRQRAVRTRVETARNLLWLQAYARDVAFLTLQ